MKLPLDHVGYYSADLPALVHRFRSMGFAVQGPVALQVDPAESAHSDPPPAVVQLSTHVMFENAYIELTTINASDPAATAGHHLEAISLLPDGIRLLLLECSDANEKSSGLAANGVAAGQPQAASRQLAHMPSVTAHFRWFGLPAGFLPNTLCGYVQHLSRKEVFDPDCMQHQNTAESVIALYCHPDTDLRSLAKLSGGNIELKADADVGSAVISGLGLAVRRISRFRRCLDDSGVTYQVHGDGIRIPASEAGGAFLQVEERL